MNPISKHLLIALLGPGLLFGTTSIHANEITQCSIIGTASETVVQHGESLMEIARRTGYGYENIVQANPDLNPWIPQTDANVTLPSRVVLPNGTISALTINLAEMRLFYLTDGDEIPCKTYPLGIGREGRETPEGHYQVISKLEKPVWRVPSGLRALDPLLPNMVPPGPDNPLGEYWLGLSVPGYGIHGTNRPLGVGRRISYGCLRMYPEHIKELYQQISIGTPVTIVYQPIKVGWDNGLLYMEVHPDTFQRFDNLFQEALKVIGRYAGAYDVDYQQVQRALDQPYGLPYQIGQITHSKGEQN